METTPFHLVAKANAAKGFGVTGGFVVVDGLEYLAAEADAPIRTGAFGQPASTTSRLVIDHVTGGLPGGMWVSFHTESADSVDAEGTRLSVGGALRRGGSEQRRARAALWFEGEPLLLEAEDGRDGARLRRAAGSEPVDVSPATEKPQKRCLETFRASRFTANEGGEAAAAGSCTFDSPPSLQKRKLAVVRWEPVAQAADAGASAPSLTVHAEPLPGTQHEDRVTGLVVRSATEILVSVVRRGRANEPARLLRRHADGVWSSLRTPARAPAIAMSAVSGGPLWIATPSEVWRHLGTERWERVPLPSLDVMGLHRQPNISTLWVSGADDVWIVVAHGARVLRTKRSTSLLEIGKR